LTRIRSAASDGTHGTEGSVATIEFEKTSAPAAAEPAEAEANASAGSAA
jgi:hypothetical protein